MKTRAIRVDSGIPIPIVRPRYTKYPFKNMKVRDSFKIGAANQVEQVRQAAYKYALRHGSKIRFSIRRTDEGFRCWRIK